MGRLLLAPTFDLNFQGFTSGTPETGTGEEMVLGLGLKSSHSSFLVFPYSAMVLQEFK